ncbi:glycoside hydrolase family 3 C-terminal domain-containing protein [Robiginitalea sediminis]|uniref:glycoside hydrolase family 3 C-terminal domain-containing protein n=1 Tax=Robiginitalea sediminis TaxID=1982593 RepID=UPI000B4BE2FE|nr:glycoside hydrolase family 3 C-terminal domain-containing protein [Robiginitalea sediminis]
MKRGLKIALKIIGIIVLLLILTGVGGWWYLKSRFLDFEGDYADKTELVELTENGHTYYDRNGNGRLDTYEDSRLPVKERAADLLSQMTIEEKIHLLKGSGLSSAMGRTEPGEGIPGAVGTIVPTPRLGIPTIYLSDGPAGLRIEPFREGEERSYYCTAFPIGTLLASTWNTELVQQVGTAMGNEALEYGIDVILGPGANIHRHPFCGRNFEYYSEDPVLTGYIGAAMVNGIESQGVGTSVKHFVANNQETNRNNNDVIVSGRAMREIYLKGFEIIVRESQPWTIMSSYNLVNGTHVAESPELLSGILRDEWGFEGLVMSDWFGGKDAAAMVRAGNDLLEPGTKKQWDALTDAHENGTLSEASIDTSAMRILELMFKSGKFENPSYGNNPDLDAHAAITRQSAAEGMVLLKNEGVLPLQDMENVALIGVTSYDFIAGGTGSGDVNEAYSVSLEEGLRSTGLSPQEGMGSTPFVVNAVAKSAYESHRAANPEAFEKPEGINAMFVPYTPPELVYSEAQMREIEAGSDVAIITIGRNSGEGGDRVERDNFLLSSAEQDMIDLTCRLFHEAGKKVVVVLNVGGVIETASWKDKPDAILLAWQGGQEGGNSVADILSGKVVPSGKLPMTFPVNVADHASHANFPLDGRPMSMTDMLSSKRKPEAEWEPNVDYTVYEEGIYVGYRHFDKENIPVSYPFGFGLSYTTFEMDSLQVAARGDILEVHLQVRNRGETPGKEVVQVYVSKPDSHIDRPVQELKVFGKTRLLAPGESQEMWFTLPVADLRYWNEEAAAWILDPGMYEIRVGASSRDIRQTALSEL